MSAKIYRERMARWLAVTLLLVSACKKDKPAAQTTDVPDQPPGPTATLDAAPAVDPLEPTVPPPPATEVAATRGDCSTDYAPRPTRDPNPMCLVEAGTFMMGAPDEWRTDDREQPVHDMTIAEAFYMDQFPVTHAQYVHYLNAVGSHTHCPTGSLERCVSISPQGIGSGIRKVDDGYEAIPELARHPVYHVGYEGAQRYCAWVGKQLPTEAQWEYAARHDPTTGRDHRYPWGDDLEAKRATCNDDDCEDGFQRGAPVGTFSGDGNMKDGSSPWGVHDMVGSGEGWTTDCFVERHTCASNCVDQGRLTAESDCKHVLRGAPSFLSASALQATYRMSSEIHGLGAFRCTTPTAAE
jgi:iron(II)-dependent oxidoreductase